MLSEDFVFGGNPALTDERGRAVRHNPHLLRYCDSISNGGMETYPGRYEDLLKEWTEANERSQGEETPNLRVITDRILDAGFNVGFSWLVSPKEYEIATQFYILLIDEGHGTIAAQVPIGQGIKEDLRFVLERIHPEERLEAVKWFYSLLHRAFCRPHGLMIRQDPEMCEVGPQAFPNPYAPNFMGFCPWMFERPRFYLGEEGAYLALETPPRRKGYDFVIVERVGGMSAHDVVKDMAAGYTPTYSYNVLDVMFSLGKALIKNTLHATRKTDLGRKVAGPARGPGYISGIQAIRAIFARNLLEITRGGHPRGVSGLTKAEGSRR